MMNKFAAQVLSMTNQCNLRCSYCDWKKDEFHRISEDEMLKAKENINYLKNMLDKDFPTVRLIEYSGGEVTLYPGLLNIMLDTFKDKWFRVVTNGTLIDDNIINSIKCHGKVFVALSIDGDTLESNHTRFNDNQKLFNKVLDNLAKLLENNIPVMLLCTLNSENILGFHNYMKFLESKYRKYIESGYLFVPAHYVFNYSGDNGTPSEIQKMKFLGYLETTEDLIIKQLDEHYKELAYFIENHKHLHSCHIPEWCLPVHFRGNSVISDGNFNTFGCGMRGKLNFGVHSIKNPSNFVDQVYDANLTDKVRFCDGENCENYCFVDWYIVDLILQGVIPIEKAQKWFVFFRDPDVIDYINNSEKLDNTFKFTYQTCNICAKTIDIEIDKTNNSIKSIKFNGGCQANQSAIGYLVKDMNIDEVIKRCQGIDCCGKGTSCPDQLAEALKSYKLVNCG